MFPFPITSLSDLLPIQPGTRTILPLLDLPGEAKVVLAALDAGVAVPPHPIPREATLLLLSGSIEFRIGEALHPVRPGEFLRIPKGEMHGVRALEPSRFIVLLSQA